MSGVSRVVEFQNDGEKGIFFWCPGAARFP
jgi:hypothetical protein